jgi:hypothetical protein
MILIMEVSKANSLSVNRPKANNVCSIISQLVTVHTNSKGKQECKAILVIYRGGPYYYETSRIPHFLDNLLTDGGDVVNLMHRPPFTSRKIPGTHFCQRLSRPQGHTAAGRIRSTERSSDLIGNRNRDLPACSIVPQPSMLPRSAIMTTRFYVTNNHLHIYKACIPLCSSHCRPTTYSIRSRDSSYGVVT